MTYFGDFWQDLLKVKDEFKTISAKEIQVASGWQCLECKLIRPFFLEKCLCTGENL